MTDIDDESGRPADEIAHRSDVNWLKVPMLVAIGAWVIVGVLSLSGVIGMSGDAFVNGAQVVILGCMGWTIYWGYLR